MTLLPRPSRQNQLRLTRAMQIVLVAIVLHAIIAHQPVGVVNGSLALLVTFFPALLERNHEIPIDPWLGLWITLAVFLHTLGSAGLYARISWWDHVTHALSASLIAAVGYTFARTIDLHSDEIHIPSRFMFIYIFVVVLAFAVIWELLEFALDVVSYMTGMTMPLAQHGLDDTILDLMFNSLGAFTVAVFAQASLSDFAETLQTWHSATE
jgi:hypothetical protein